MAPPGRTTTNDGGAEATQMQTHRRRHLSKQERKARKRRNGSNVDPRDESEALLAQLETLPPSLASVGAVDAESNNGTTTKGVKRTRGTDAKKVVTALAVPLAQKKDRKLRQLGRTHGNTPNTNSNGNTESKNAHGDDDGGGDDDDDAGGGSNSDDEERIRLRCLESYTAIEVPKQPPADISIAAESSAKNGIANTDTVADEGGCRTLGKWFPNAILIKSAINYTNTGRLVLLQDTDGSHPALTEDDVRVDNPRSSLVLFYQYTTCGSAPPWGHAKLRTVMSYLALVARIRHLGGRIRVAPEGVNATISAVDTPGATAQETLRHFAEDLKVLDGRVFARTDFKYIDGLPADRHFKEFKILPVQELVFYDIGEDEAPLDAEEDRDVGPRPDGTTEKDKLGDDDDDDHHHHRLRGGIHLDAKEYHKMLQKDNTVVIDVRNHYETILGRFDGQQQRQQKRQPAAAASDGKANKGGNNDAPEAAPAGSGAEYIDPLMRKSTDFKSWLAAKETKEKLKDKTVLMYCTGGIRCERASAYLKKEMGDQVEGVYQLKGGIERYLKTFKDGGFWRGKNFVFDKREAVGVDNPEGDGGVIRRQDKKKDRNQKDGTGGDIPAKCCVCGDPWDRYVGKKKCSTCGVPVLMCDKCMSEKPDKTPGMELKVRCPLCVAENITVLAKEVEFTANGIKGKVKADSRRREGKTEIESNANGKAAESVLKWGGGHANQKKQLKKMKRRLCQFGASCVRKDCFFFHPERDPSDITSAK